MSYQQDLAKAARERRVRLYGNNLMPIVRTVTQPPPLPAPPPVEVRRAPIFTLTAVMPLRPTAASIVELVAIVHDVKSSDIVGKRRTRKFVDARSHSVAALSEFRPDMSLSHIGRIMDLDHTTVIHHRKTWPTRANKLQREIAAVYDALSTFTKLDTPDAEPMVG